MSDVNHPKKSEIDFVKYCKCAILFLVVIIVISAGYFAIYFGISEQNKYKNEANNIISDYYKYRYNSDYKSCFGVSFSDRYECLVAASTKARENERDEQDLVAQRMTAVWTFIMGGAAILGLCISTVGVLLVWTTFGETRRTAVAAIDASAEARRANDQALEFFAAENRPWLQIEAHEIISEFDDDNDIELVGVNIKVKNIGRTPALNAEVKIDHWCGDLPLIGTQSIEEFANNCDDRLSQDWGNEVIFPNCLADLYACEIEKTGKRINYIIVCVSYWSSGRSPAVFHTAFAIERSGGRIASGSYSII